MEKLIIQLIKFSIVGAIAAAIDIGVLMLLKELLEMDVLVASALSFSASVIVNYLLSMLFVFEGNNHNKVKEFIIFVALSVGGLGLNQVIMWVGTEYTAIYYLCVKVLSFIFVSAYNFITRKIFLEKKAPQGK